MNVGNVIVVGIVLILAALACYRAWRKGAPRECGGSRKLCGGSCHCHCHDKK